MIDKTKSESVRERAEGSRAVERYFQLSLVLMLVTAFLTLASTGRIDPPTVAFVSLALLIRLITLALGRDRRLSPRAVSLF